MRQFRSVVLIAAINLTHLGSLVIGEEPSDVNKAPRERTNTATGRLLDQLEVQNSGVDRFKDSWLSTLKAIVDLGTEAVPELTAELDATTDNLMLRCCGFTLRAIGDKRAVPALIRSVPKTLLPPDSDMGLRSNDPDLAKWAQQHELRDSDSDGNEYGFGRPVCEIFGALNRLTDHKMNESELYSIFLSGLESQREMKHELFHRVAKQWSEWWEQNVAEFKVGAEYAQVNLPQLPSKTMDPPTDGAHYKTGGVHSNWILESVFDPKATFVFFDLDTSRTGRLPKKWRDVKNIEPLLDEIRTWAEREGFDLMGMEYTDQGGTHYYAFRSIGMEVWELDSGRWKMKSKDVAIGELKTEGSSAGDLLLHRDNAKTIDPQATASYFFITRDHTPGLLFVGIEVKDDSLQPGGKSLGDNELRPIAFKKGRRFAYTEFEEVK